MQNLEGQNEKSVENFVDSEVFARLFKEGMMMVEEAAGYLEGPGRQVARSLSRRGALAYAAESMRLTTRLMHIASWLLVQRSIRRREMTPLEAGHHKYALGGRDTGAGRRFLGTPELPSALQNLVSRSHRLYERVCRLDDLLYARQFPANDGFKLEPAPLQSAVPAPVTSFSRSLGEVPSASGSTPSSTSDSTSGSTMSPRRSGVKAQMARLEAAFGGLAPGKPSGN